MVTRVVVMNILLNKESLAQGLKNFLTFYTMSSLQWLNSIILLSKVQKFKSNWFSLRIFVSNLLLPLKIKQG